MMTITSAKMTTTVRKFFIYFVKPNKLLTTFIFFSAIFPWWDRIFGTFRAETEPVTFKNADAISGFHPILVNLRPILRTIIGAKV
jgi:hypothetical protein